MKREYPALTQLEAEYGRNKKIPGHLKEVILKTLSHFPELKETKITFRLEKDEQNAHAPTPSVIHLLIPGVRRKYTVTIPDSGPQPLEQALLRNLPFEGQMAAIAHELAIIAFFEKTGNLKAIRMLRRGKEEERQLRRQADIDVIERGLGFELYLHATYLRRIPGFLELRKDIEVNSLNPHEILEALPPEQLQEVHRF